MSGIVINDLPPIEWIDDQCRRAFGPRLGVVTLDDDGLAYFVVDCTREFVTALQVDRLAKYLGVEVKHIAMAPSQTDAIRFVVNLRHDTRPETPSALAGL